jgi:hypothetical protein
MRPADIPRFVFQSISEAVNALIAASTTGVDREELVDAMQDAERAVRLMMDPVHRAKFAVQPSDRVLQQIMQIRERVAAATPPVPPAEECQACIQELLSLMRQPRLPK